MPMNRYGAEIDDLNRRTALYIDKILKGAKPADLPVEPGVQISVSLAERRYMMEDRFLKRLRKKARKGLRGWPIATVAFYGPNLSQATKVTVGIVPSENAEVKELREWKVDRGDIRADPGIAQEILEFIEQHRVLSVAMTDSIIGCPHQEGIDYEGEWCPACEFWHGRDRFRGRRSIRFSLLVPTR